ncbi:MAG: tetratricopeptide repeat protein [Saccharothrix sp.]|nr:tetratricopeptide repeat protein [Saccharothrix sp.]
MGVLEIRHGRTIMSAGPARQRSVLAVLAVEAGRLVSVDALIDRVWGERPPSRARSTLRTYLTHLRRALAPTGMTVIHRYGGYTLAVDANAVDLHRFHELLDLARAAHEPQQALLLVEEALGLWRGEPLAELDTVWARVVRERLRRERAAAEADRIDWALACDRHRQVLPELAARAEAEPLDERVAAQLMLALYRSGRQADALVHYQHTRQRLVEELGADPGTALQELHQRILTADSALALTETTTTTVAGTPPLVVPRQLPAPPRWFTGRADHLAALDAALDKQGTMVISAIGGAGGIGKTWLALTWAHRNLDRFPDGQLFVDLHGFSPQGTPTDPALALRGFLDALGIAADRIPVDPEARAALYRSLVAERRMLIVLDNAATVEQVVPLLPGGTTCTVLVTSRHRLPGLTARHGAHPLLLGVLTDAESRAMLVAALSPDRVAADDHAIGELIALCGRFPLALGLVVALGQSGVPLAEAVAELRRFGLDALDADDPTASLPAVLSWSLHHLTDRQRTVFALLGIAPGPDIGLPAATSLTGLSERETRAVLRALADASLIDPRAGGRYAMHDLVRAYATTLAYDLPDPTREAALARVIDFYLHTAYSVHHLLEPFADPIPPKQPTPGVRPQRLPDLPAAMAWLETEYAHLLAAQHTAVAHRHHHVVWHLAQNLTPFYYRRGHLYDFLAVWLAALDASASMPSSASRIRAYRFVAVAHLRLRQHETALEGLYRALALAEHYHDTTEQALIHTDLGRTWGVFEKHREALDHSRRALDLLRTLDRPADEADALNAVGWHAARLGDYDTARDHCQAALALCRRHHHSEGEVATLDSLAYIAHQTGHYHEAVDRYRQALRLIRALDHPYQVASILEHSGHSHAALGQHDHARAVWREALKLHREQGRVDGVARVQRELDDLDSEGDPYIGSATLIGPMVSPADGHVGRAVVPGGGVVEDGEDGGGGRMGSAK